MSLPSYAYVAEIIETKLPLPTTRPTRSGIRMFLMLAADERKAFLCPPSSPAWMKLWRQIDWSRRMARILHVDIPPRLWDEERARLAAKLATPDFTFDDPAERERALRWTRRRR